MAADSRAGHFSASPSHPCRWWPRTSRGRRPSWTTWRRCRWCPRPWPLGPWNSRATLLTMHRWRSWQNAPGASSSVAERAVRACSNASSAARRGTSTISRTSNRSRFAFCAPRPAPASRARTRPATSARTPRSRQPGTTCGWRKWPLVFHMRHFRDGLEPHSRAFPGSHSDDADYCCTPDGWRLINCASCALYRSYLPKLVLFGRVFHATLSLACTRRRTT